MVLFSASTKILGKYSKEATTGSFHTVHNHPPI